MTRRKERIEKGVAAVIERLLARFEAPDPLTLPEVLDESFPEFEDWSLYEVMYPERVTVASARAGGDLPPERVSGRRAITIRVPNSVLQAFRRQSVKTGTPYQTLMNRALKSVAEGFV